MKTRTAARRWAALLLCCALLAALPACGAEAPAAPSPTAPPAPSPTPEPTPPPDYSGLLAVSECMPKNRASLYRDGFPDWVELENISGAPLSLDGWTLSDGGERSALALSGTLAAGELLLVTLGEEGGFSLADGETLLLLAPDGSVQQSLLCADVPADYALQRQEDGSFAASPWISPGLPNGNAGYEAFSASRAAPGPLVINEVMVSNCTHPLHSGDEVYDWVEVRNISRETVDLSGYCLSDDCKNLGRWQFPARRLAPGEVFTVLCDAEREDNEWDHDANTHFSLNAQHEQLYLSAADGTLLDFAALREIPTDGSMGREDGRAGFLYYAEPSPKKLNSGGCRRVSAPPRLTEPDGVFDGVESVEVKLASDYPIFYTLNGRLPSLESERYEAPLRLGETCVLRAVAVEDDAVPSAPLTASYFLNEGHSLPVLSLVVNDRRGFQQAYDYGMKAPEFSAEIALYDGEHSFRHACSLRMKGWTSLNMEKKSLGVVFKGRYGGDLEADVFGNGVTRFHSLAIRAGQDYIFTIIRNELMQDLCLEASDRVLAQASKYCILYINGVYRGIYALKEDFSAQFYASHRGVSPESVENVRGPVTRHVDLFEEVIDYAMTHDMREEAHYRHVCEYIDVESLIDWFLLEGYCDNTDIAGNVRFMRSSENGNRWELCFYDLDWTFRSDYPFSGLLLQNVSHNGHQMPELMIALCKNAEFRAQVLARYAELVRGVLSNGHLLERLDYYEALLTPDADRDRLNWGLSVTGWHDLLDLQRVRFRDQDYAALTITQLCTYLDVSPEERAFYFGE